MTKDVISKGFNTYAHSDGRRWSYPETAAGDPSALGPFTVAFYTSGFSTTGISAGRIYYPVGQAAVMPAAIWCGGLGNDINQAIETSGAYINTDNFEFGMLLASHGFCSMHINPPNPGSDGPATRATAIVNASNSLAAEHTRAGAGAFGMVQVNNMCAMGHSFGGGGAFLAANNAGNARIKGAIGLQPVFASDGYPTTLADPGLIFSGNGDATDDYQAVYNSIPSTTPKIIGKHNANQYASAHDAGRALTSNLVISDGRAVTPAHTQDTILRQLVVAFMQYYLNGNAAYKPYLATGTGLTSFAYNDV